MRRGSSLQPTREELIMVLTVGSVQEVSKSVSQDVMRNARNILKCLRYAQKNGLDQKARIALNKSLAGTRMTIRQLEIMAITGSGVKITSMKKKVQPVRSKTKAA